MQTQHSAFSIQHSAFSIQHSAFKNSLTAAFFGAIALFSVNSYATTYTLSDLGTLSYYFNDDGRPNQYDIDENNQVVDRGYISQNLVPLSGGSFGLGYSGNNRNQIAGSTFYTGNDGFVSYVNATIWTNGIPVDIGKTNTPDDFSAAYDINNFGSAVGETGNGATLWDNGITFNLNDLVSNSILGNWHLEAATGINDNGWIVGQMYRYSDLNGVENGTFLLTPDAPSAVPLPAAVWLFGSALGGFGLMRRRKA